MNYSRRSQCFFSLALFVCMSFAEWMVAPIRGESFLVRDGQPLADIVIAEQPPRMARLAAGELQSYIEKISGATLSITNRPGQDVPAHIYVGKSIYTDQLKITDDGLAHDAFRIVSGINWLVLLGQDRDFTPPELFARNHSDIPRMLEQWDTLTGEKWGNPHTAVYRRYNPILKIWDYDARGSLNAVYEFLRGIGVRWYMPGDLGEVVPARKNIELGCFDKLVRPDFPYRNLGDYTPHFDGGTKDAVLWRLRLGLAYGQELWGIGWTAHGLNYVHGRDEVKKAHPEYYALYGGKRMNGSPYPWWKEGVPCLSSPGLFQATVKYARDFFRIYPDDPLVSIMPADAYVSLCECELCRGKSTPERGYNGQLSDYVWDFVNRVAIELYRTNPDKKVLCGAYGSYVLPPTKIAKLSPNVAVCIIEPRYTFYEEKTYKNFRENRKEWLNKLTSGDLYTYAHYLYSRPGGSYEGVPVYFPHIIAEDMHALKGISKGDYIELSQGKQCNMHAPGFNHLNVYVTAKMYWNASQDIEALLDEYYEKFYGPAQKEMKAFIRFSEKNWPSMLKQAKPVDEALKLLAAAKEAAGDTVYGKRIDLLVEYCKPLKQLRDRLARGRENVPEAAAFERKKSDISLDGKLDDKFWEKTWVYSLSELETGRQPALQTSFRTAWADDAMYFGIHCQERSTKNLKVAATKNGDTTIWQGDCVELLFETQVHSYYQIAVSPSGAVINADRKEGVNTIWSSQAQAAVFVGDDYWSVEIRIPVAGEDAETLDRMNGVAGRRPTKTYPWFINVCRQRIRDNGNEVSAWSPTGKTTFHDLMKFGELVVR